MRTNGELFFLERIKHQLKIVFDVGSHSDSLFLDLNCEVHYFEPVLEYLNILKTRKNNNSKSNYNDYGLSNFEEELIFYIDTLSFLDRNKSLDQNMMKLTLKKAADYIENNNIGKIDFLKIDTEGFELNVLKGFENKLKIIDIIQFEYGGTFLDAGIKLLDVINFLKNEGFESFAYLSSNSLIEIIDFSDHYQYCNIVCFNKNFSSNLKI